MKLRFSVGAATSRLTIVIIVGVVFLLVVGTNAYGWISTHRSILLLTRNLTQPPATAIFVPNRAPAVMSLLANIDDLSSLNRLAMPDRQRRTADRQLKNIKRQLGNHLHLDYQTEIAPWLGSEITLAITDLDFDRVPQNGSEPGYLAILSSRNPQVSRQKIQAGWDRQLASKRLKLESYQGVNIANNDRDKLASAIVGDKYVLFANHPKVLREAINNLQTSNLSILANPDYQQALAANNHHKIGCGYARLPELNRWLGKTSGEKYRLAGLNLGIDRQGLIADAILYPQAGVTLAPPESQVAVTQDGLINALKYLPRQSTIAIAGTDLQHWQQQLTNILPELQPLMSQLDRGIANIDRQIGIDLTQDIFSWTTGEYALAAIPNPTRPVTDWVFVAERTQPERLDRTISHFDEIASLAGYNVGLLPWNGRQVIGWTKLVTDTTLSATQLIAQVPGAHTTVADKYTILASSVAAMDSTLKAIDRQSILDSERYHQGTNLLTATATGYLYGNWQTILPLLSGLPNISINNSIESGTQRISLLLQTESQP
jgi:Protein of unknown function (DUF3352)